LAPDPTRPDCQQWITSYASLFHRPGAPLFDLLQQAKAGLDARLLFDWWAADYCTAPDVAQLSPEARANPSMPDRSSLAEAQQAKKRAVRQRVLAACAVLGLDKLVVQAATRAAIAPASEPSLVSGGWFDRFGKR
jgi:hypothetical protein